MGDDPSDCDILVARLLTARKIVIFTGAGVSAESGIETFRDKQNGVWAKYDPYELASPEAWERNKGRVWAWYESRRSRVAWALPNAAHYAIARLERALRDKTGQTVEVVVVTQNIDDLHERAGSEFVIHLHGSLFCPRCSVCEKETFFTDVPAGPDVETLEPPQCPACGGAIRPGIVWFGEMLPPVELEIAKLAARECDVFIVVGTSGTVYPAAAIPFEALEKKKFVASINTEHTQSYKFFSHYWQESAGNAFEQIIKKIESL